MLNPMTIATGLICTGKAHSRNTCCYWTYIDDKFVVAPCPHRLHVEGTGKDEHI